MARQNASRTIQSYLQLLTEQLLHYATLRLFDGLELAARGRMCLDAQVPVLNSPEASEYACSLIALVSYRRNDSYRQEVLQIDSHYDPGEVMALGPARWNQLADTMAYQLVSQMVQWKKDKEVAVFSYLAPTTGLKPDRQRFYL